MSQATFLVIFGTLLRSGIMVLAGWLVKQGALPSGSLEDWVTAVALAIGTLCWSLYEKYVNRKLLKAALEAPAGATEAEIRATLKG